MGNANQSENRQGRDEENEVSLSKTEWSLTMFNIHL